MINTDKGSFYLIPNKMPCHNLEKVYINTCEELKCIYLPSCPFYNGFPEKNMTIKHIIFDVKNKDEQFKKMST